MFHLITKLKTDMLVLRETMVDAKRTSDKIWPGETVLKVFKATSKRLTTKTVL